MSPVIIPIVLVAGAGAAIVGAGAPQRVRVPAAAVLTAATCGASLLGALWVLRTGHRLVWSSSQILPLGGVRFALDPFGAMFVLVSAVVALPATVYWTGYRGHGLDSRTASVLMALFVTALLVVPMASSVTTFLFFWELMALTSLGLVLVDHRHRAEARSAAQWYGLMTHAGAATILLALVILAAHSGGQRFGDLRAHAELLSPALRGTVFVLALVGFASKAGAVPLHVWLPKAHPEAPSPASALMSGAMVNLGIYGIVLVGDRLLGGGPAWWWLTVLALGVLSALFGAVQAATSTDVKRMLAFSTADNMGLVLIGVGASGLASSGGHHLLGALTMVATLLLVVNHAGFKGSLFLAAGSIQAATGTRDLDRLGGLVHRMPATAAMFVVGGLAMAAMVPLNGFVGEWLLFQSLLHALPSSSSAVIVAIPIAVAALALTGGLTAAAVVKAIGVGLLGRPRSDGAARAAEVGPAMRLGTGLLAALCVVLGVAPVVVIPALERAVATVVPGTPVHLLGAGLDLEVTHLTGAIAPLWMALAVIAAIGGVLTVRRLLRRRQAHRAPWPNLRTAANWGCGRQVQTPRMQYTATSFAEPLQRVFDDVLRPDRDVEVSHSAESRWFVEKVAYRSTIDDAVERLVYRPVLAGVEWWGRQARRVPNGSVHRYLAFGLVALIVILVVVA